MSPRMSSGSSWGREKAFLKQFLMVVGLTLAYDCASKCTASNTEICLVKLLAETVLLLSATSMLDRILEVRADL